MIVTILPFLILSPLDAVFLVRREDSGSHVPISATTLSNIPSPISQMRTPRLTELRKVK